MSIKQKRREKGEGSLYVDSKNVWHRKIYIGQMPDGKRKYKEFQSLSKKKSFKLQTNTLKCRNHPS